jgi:hypothetical protein
VGEAVALSVSPQTRRGCRFAHVRRIRAHALVLTPALQLPRANALAFAAALQLTRMHLASHTDYLDP